MEFVNFEEAKTRLGKTEEQLQEMIRKGELRGFRDGGMWKFRKEDIDAMAGGPAPAAGKESGDTLMSIDADILFAEEEEVPADSAAETWIAADTEGVFPASGAAVESARGVQEALSAPEAEPAPLALSPETDESSLGAVLSDEELGAEAEAEEPVIAVDAESGLAAVVGSGSSATAVAPSRTRVVTLVEPPAHHGQFTIMLGLSAAALVIAVLVLMAVMTGAEPGFLKMIGSENAPLVLMVMGAMLVGAAVLIGYFMEKQRAAREAIVGG